MIKNSAVFFACLFLGAVEIGAAFYAGSGGAPLSLSLARSAGSSDAAEGERPMRRSESAADSGEGLSAARDRRTVAAEAPDAVAEAAGEPSLEAAGEYSPEAAAPAESTLLLCPRMEVSNAPAADSEDRVVNFAPVVAPAEGVELMMPVRGSCLSSGYGDRDGKLHKGVDFQSRPAEMVTAAGDGVIVEAMYRDDYGNMVLIDHGEGVYTRYAHLESFAPGVAEGAAVTAGTPLGRMGNSAAYAVPIHLHYEILAGDYDTPQGSFGLTPLDLFALPAA